MLREHSFRKAYISIGVGYAVMAVAIVVFWPPLSEIESNVMGGSGFVVALATMFWLYHREDRARERVVAPSAGQAAGGDGPR